MKYTKWLIVMLYISLVMLYMYISDIYQIYQIGHFWDVQKNESVNTTRQFVTPRIWIYYLKGETTCYWYVNTSLSDKKSVYSKSLILRWPVRLFVLVNIIMSIYVHIEQGLIHMVWKSCTYKQKVDMLRLSKRSIKMGWKGKLCVWQILFAKEQRGRTQIDVIYWIGRILKYIQKSNQFNFQTKDIACFSSSRETKIKGTLYN